TGAGRWAPPKPPEYYGTRQDPYDATQFGSPCPQNISQFGNSIPLPIPPNTVPVPGSADSEDCLFLNIYAPASRLDKGGDPLPVFFWIHGGSNQYGEGSSYDPTPLVTQGHVIAVTINYRLGALGWLAHPLLDGNTPNSSGNYGLLDQQFAMRWVKDNIAAFGGDPQKVTIAGESAGALDVCSHLASPTAAGLFRGAIIESGCIIFQFPQPVLETISGDPFVHASGCTTLACLQEAPVSAVLAAALPLAWLPVLGPNVATLPELPQQAFANGNYNKVPVIQGTNLDEGRLFVPLFQGIVNSGGPATATTIPYASAVAELFAAYPNPPLATIESQYPIANYLSDGAAAAPGEAVAAIITDSLFACTARTADQLFAKYVPVWAYEFKDTNAPELFNLPTVFPYGATHASELQFIFNPDGFFPNINYQVATDPFPLSPAEKRLSQEMVRYWTNFVATLDPNRSGTGAQIRQIRYGTGWPSYVSADDNAQALTTPYPHPEFGFGAEHQCGLWEQLGLESGL
ncbi:MAG: carboxylesterase family protein, partial [Alphaproteobacteria bacterium]|nr:carboxylesterase family protein [Alphaproteobacteria bacterium]